MFGRAQTGRRALLIGAGMALGLTLSTLVSPGASLPPWAFAAATEPYTSPPYVVLGPNTSASVRVVTTNASCPNVAVGANATESEKMSVRAAPSPAYPVLTCEWDGAWLLQQPSQNGQRASVNGIALPRIASSPQRIAIEGDTGCRLKDPDFQACNDPVAWPYERISQSIAAYTPDLLAHMGDYHYRESPCPTDNAGCAGSPDGYNWEVWKADFFEPAAATLSLAPWIFVRGNHEDCTRAWEGWFRFLDPYPYADYEQDCQAFTEPYNIPFDSFNIAMLDSASSDQAEVNEQQLPIYRRQIAAIDDMVGTNTWLFMHHPIYGLRSRSPGNDQPATNLTLDAAAQGQFPDGVQGIFGGHIHLFAALSFALSATGTSYPTQWIIGHSGDALEGSLSITWDSLRIAGQFVTPSSYVIDDDWGWATMEPSDDGSWAVTARDRNGRTMATCSFAARHANCDASSQRHDAGS